jgi:hypothetical protein
VRVRAVAHREEADDVIAKVRAICRGLEGSVEEVAWVGVRWKVRKRTYAHVLEIKKGKPPAYFKAAGANGWVLTFRAEEPIAEALGAMGFFRPVWSTQWGTKVVGTLLDERTDWQRVAKLLHDSHALLAHPAPRSRLRE